MNSDTYPTLLKLQKATTTAEREVLFAELCEIIALRTRHKPGPIVQPVSAPSSAFREAEALRATYAPKPK